MTTAQIIQFPDRRPKVTTDEQAVDCRNCIHARFGALTHCTIVGEDIIDEANVAPMCESYEPEEQE